MGEERFDIVTWNVNSLRMRLERVLAWLDRHRPAVLCLQETKCPDAEFPADEFEARGYRVRYAGQEDGLNGVAIAARADLPLEGVSTELPGLPDDHQRRFISADVGGVRVIDVYVPNGQAVGADAYFFKLDWLSRLHRHLIESHDPARELVLLGDFNIAPADQDLWDPEGWQGQLHCSGPERSALGYLEGWGLQDAQRRLLPEGPCFTWFDYRDTYREFSPAKGLRIDLIYVTAPLTERLREVHIDLEERAGEKPSDHAPVTARFAPR